MCPSVNPNNRGLKQVYPSKLSTAKKVSISKEFSFYKSYFPSKNLFPVSKVPNTKNTTLIIIASHA